MTVTAKRPTLAVDKNGSPIQGTLYPRKTTVIAFTGTAAVNTTAFAGSVVRLIATEDCYVKFGVDTVVAVAATDFLLKANIAEYFTQKEGYISAVRVTTSGSLFVTEME